MDIIIDTCLLEGNKRNTVPFINYDYYEFLVNNKNNCLFITEFSVLELFHGNIINQDSVNNYLKTNGYHIKSRGSSFDTNNFLESIKRTEKNLMEVICDFASFMVFTFYLQKYDISTNLLEKLINELIVGELQSNFEYKKGSIINLLKNIIETVNNEFDLNATIDDILNYKYTSLALLSDYEYDVLIYFNKIVKSMRKKKMKFDVIDFMNYYTVLDADSNAIFITADRELAKFSYTMASVQNEPILSKVYNLDELST